MYVALFYACYLCMYFLLYARVMYACTGVCINECMYLRYAVFVICVYVFMYVVSVCTYGIVWYVCMYAMCARYACNVCYVLLYMQM